MPICKIHLIQKFPVCSSRIFKVRAKVLLTVWNSSREVVEISRQKLFFSFSRVLVFFYTLYLLNFPHMLVWRPKTTSNYASIESPSQGCDTCDCNINWQRKDSCATNHRVCFSKCRCRSSSLCCYYMRRVRSTIPQHEFSTTVISIWVYWKMSQKISVRVSKRINSKLTKDSNLFSERKIRGSLIDHRV
jgi:hypothetical protein